MALQQQLKVVVKLSPCLLGTSGLGKKYEFFILVLLMYTAFL